MVLGNSMGGMHTWLWAVKFLVPGSSDTLGHGTTGNARFWKARVEGMLKSAPKL
jgi:hypothetical protein